MIVKTKLLPPGAAAFSMWPFIFVHPDYADRVPILLHEGVHLEQQKRWAIYGLGVGLLVWFALYMLALPVGWNPWRYRWELEAYRAQGYLDSGIKKMMKKAPYYLWWS